MNSGASPGMVRQSCCRERGRGEQDSAVQSSPLNTATPSSEPTLFVVYEVGVGDVEDEAGEAGLGPRGGEKHPALLPLLAHPLPHHLQQASETSPNFILTHAVTCSQLILSHVFYWHNIPVPVLR